MNTHDHYAQLLDGLKAGDEAAAKELLEQFGELVIRSLERRIKGTALQGLVSPSDIVQSTLVRLLTHIDEVREADDIPSYLRAMATWSLIRRIRMHYAQKRDARRQTRDESVLSGLVDTGETPSELVRIQEDYEKVMEGFTDDERTLAEAWLAGGCWDEAAVVLGATPETQQKRWSRLKERLRQRLA